MTNLIRFTPSHDMRRLQREIDGIFDSFFSPSSNENEGASWAPRVDLSETEDAYLVHVDVPGMQKEDLNIDVHEGRLTISGERNAEQQDDGHKYVRVERSYGRFYRSFTLPQTVKEDEIEATYENGVLSVRVPKAEETKPRRIEVA